MTTSNAYDQAPYESFPFAQSHPDRLAAIAQLLGVNAPPPATARVLEIGCAAGGNLLPMALSMPGARFVGIDLSPVQIAQGQAVIRDLGLSNIALQAMDLAACDDRLGTFDYILCHGVYSWIPDTVQQALLQLVARRLAPDGVAYISYNTLPGWNMRGMVRDLMRYHAQRFATAGEQVTQARAILDFMAQSAPADNNAYGALLRSELEMLRKQPDYYILHEHLEENNQPVYFHEFAARAAQHGLQYLAEAEFGAMLATQFAPEVAHTVRSIAPDVIRQEQIMDFLRNRTFRQTLLVHETVNIDRVVTAARVPGLHIASPLKAEGGAPDPHGTAAAVYHAPNGGHLRTAEAITKAALGVLADAWPATVPFDELLQRARERLTTSAAPQADTLAADLLQAYAAGLVELHALPLRFPARPGKRPAASALARWQARHGKFVTNLRHEALPIDDYLARLLPLLDGSRNNEDIAKIVADWPANGEKAPLAVVRERVKQILSQLAHAALLVD